MTPKEFTFDAAYQPQVRAKRGTREIMLDVIIALLPALCVGVWQFGAQALIPLAVSVVSCVFFEWAYRKLLKKPDTIGDLSAVVTGILLAFTLPANCKWWLPDHRRVFRHRGRQAALRRHRQELPQPGARRPVRSCSRPTRCS